MHRANKYVLSKRLKHSALSIGQIITFNKGVLLINALVLSNLCEYSHKSYIGRN